MTQQAWETAMGMRGYVGSPAEREDRNELATLPDAARRATRTLSSVLVHRYEWKPAKHYKLFWDGDRPYILIGFYSKRREYLTGFKTAHGGALIIFTIGG